MSMDGAYRDCLTVRLYFMWSSVRLSKTAAMCGAFIASSTVAVCYRRHMALIGRKN